MRKIKILLFLLSTLGLLNSCLVPGAPKHHDFSSQNNDDHNPKLFIFSTPRQKNYVVQNFDINSQIFIKSAAFEDVEKFYLMDNVDFFDKKSKQFILKKSNIKFYKNDYYKNITLKIIIKNGENYIIDYKIDK